MTALVAFSDQSDITLWGPRGWAAVALAIAFVIAAAAYRRHRNAAPAQETTATAPVPVKHCAVEFCDDPVQVHVHAGHEWWDFCHAHGVPYLIEDFQGTKEDAA